MEKKIKVLVIDDSIIFRRVISKYLQEDPELEVVERHEHSRKVTYVEEGKDAAVAYGSVDFRFKNTLDKPIRIYATTDDWTVTTRIVRIDT